MKNLALVLLSSLTLLACTKEQPAQVVVEKVTDTVTNVAPDFDTRMQQLAQDYFALRPETATYFGVPDEKAGAGTSSRLGNYSPVGEAQRRSGLSEMLDELAGIDETTLTDSQKISLQLVKTEAGNAYAPATLVDYGSVLGEYGVWFIPYVASHLTGPHIEIPAILEDKMAVRNRVDAEAYLSRLIDYARVLDEVIEKMEFDRDLGVVPPDFSIDRAIVNITLGLANPATESTLVSTFSQKLTDAGIEQADEYVARAIVLVAEHVYPANKRLIDALSALRPLASHAAGVGRLPNGAAFYQAMITHMTDTNLSADEIHAIGLVEVDRIHGEMDKLLKTISYTEGTVGARISDMLRDPAYIYSNTAEGKAQLMADLAADLALADAKLPQWFGKLPQQEGALPLNLMEAKIDAWIAEQLEPTK